MVRLKNIDTFDGEKERYRKRGGEGILHSCKNSRTERLKLFSTKILYR
jgi:hypothetical protein